ncbi:MAG: hypothetical protein HC872_00735 [Gammaproteobacteria bacterium]|nr:hypothetical protein [Gammaproteobacteria bacterium]
MNLVRTADDSSTSHLGAASVKSTKQLLVTSMVVSALALLAVRPASAQAAGWSGWARCEVNTQGPGYEQKDTHTWFVNGARGSTTATQGTGSWQVVGKGNLSQGNPAQTAMRAAWAINGGSTPASDVRFGVVTVATGQVAIRRFHSQLGTQGAVVGYVQQIISNSPRTPTTISGTVWEWQFPTVQGSATGQTIAGTSSTTHPGIGWGYMQASGSTITSTCSWQFGNGYAPSPPPAIALEPPPDPSGSQPPPSPPPPPSQPPADPCQVPVRGSGTVRIVGVVPRSFREGDRITVCGSQLSRAALEDQYAVDASIPSLSSPNTATFVLIGQRSLMMLDPVISRRGDRIVFTAGRLYERSELSTDYDVLVPVEQPPQRWAGELTLRLQGTTDVVAGPKVVWNAR